MISIVIPTLNSKDQLPATLTALFPALLEGLVKELIIVDGGSVDATLLIADEAGAKIVTAAKGRGEQLKAGGKAAKADWMLFLHADTVLNADWLAEVQMFINSRDHSKAGIFRFALDDDRKRARILEMIVRLRCLVFALPYGDQGLLISRQLYDQIGGYRPIALMEDVDIVSTIGRARLHYFKAKAVTSAIRYQKQGYLRRMAVNAKCLAMWFAGVSPDKILEKYR